MGIGIPPLAGGIIIEAVNLIVADLVLLGIVQQTQWGLFLNGVPAVTAESVVSFEAKQDYRISDYLIEQGGFETYNKVAVPFDVKLRFSQGGSISDRANLQSQIDGIIGSTTLFDAVTPTKVYQSVNPVHQDVRHTARDGVGLLVIDVYCQQVRVTTTTQFASSTSPTNTTTNATSSGSSLSPNNSVAQGFDSINQPQSPSASPQVSNGTVQAQPPTPAQQAAVDKVLAQSSLPF